ncbi:30S ribosomal protein S16 [Gaopeijia maritima]|uniref:30S ribosomal protein S16 n=1 Tax=Gaopeijia maritima TaxID=3119007 RepID=UPI003288DF3F
MAVRIRLKRMGRKKQPHYRVVVADSRSPRDGRFVESLGYYKPLSNPARLVLDLDRIDFWIGEGASPSNTVKTLISKARSGGDDTVAVGEVDLDARKQEHSEALAARRAAEKKAAAEAEAAAKAEAEAAAKAEAAAAAEAEAAAAAEAEAAEGDEAAEAEEPAAEAEADDGAAAEDDEAETEKSE